MSIKLMFDVEVYEAKTARELMIAMRETLAPYQRYARSFNLTSEIALADGTIKLNLTKKLKEGAEIELSEFGIITQTPLDRLLSYALYLDRERARAELLAELDERALAHRERSLEIAEEADALAEQRASELIASGGDLAVMAESLARSSLLVEQLTAAHLRNHMREILGDAGTMLGEADAAGEAAAVLATEEHPEPVDLDAADATEALDALDAAAEAEQLAAIVAEQADEGDEGEPAPIIDLASRRRSHRPANGVPATVEHL